MENILKLKFTEPLINFVTDEVIKDQDFGKILDAIFDRVPLKSNKNFALYNDMVISIRSSRRKDEEYIETTKNDLESLKTILIDAASQTPELNRAVSFLTETMDNTIEEHIKNKGQKQPPNSP